MESPENKEVRFVEANLQNLKELTAIASRSFLEAYPQNADHENMELYLKDAFREKELERQLLNKDSIFFIMKIGGKNMAYAKLRWDRNPSHFKTMKVIELERFYFLDEFKSQGYGSQFLQYCFNFSRKNCFAWMWLLVWEENITGTKFYEYKGFEIFDRKIFHFGNESSDDVLMKLKL